MNSSKQQLGKYFFHFFTHFLQKVAVSLQGTTVFGKKFLGIESKFRKTHLLYKRCLESQASTQRSKEH